MHAWSRWANFSQSPPAQPTLPYTQSGLSVPPVCLGCSLCTPHPNPPWGCLIPTLSSGLHLNVPFLGMSVLTLPTQTPTSDHVLIVPPKRALLCRAWIWCSAVCTAWASGGTGRASELPQAPLPALLPWPNKPPYPSAQVQLLLLSDQRVSVPCHLMELFKQASPIFLHEARAPYLPFFFFF